MGWVVAVVAVAVVAAVLVGLDRAVARGWFDRRRPRPPRAPSGSAPALFAGLVEVYQPSQAHFVAEQERQRLDIHYAGDDAPPFDLDGGIVRLTPPRRSDPEADA